MADPWAAFPVVETQPAPAQGNADAITRNLVGADPWAAFPAVEGASGQGGRMAPLSAPPMSRAEALGAGLKHGLTFGFHDELKGLERAGEGDVFTGGYRYFTGQPGAGQAYERGKADDRAHMERARADHPVAAYGGEIGSMLAPGMLAAKAIKGGLAARTAISSAIGGGMGAVQGAGTADEDRGWGALTGGAIGTALGAAGEIGVSSLGALWGKVFGGATKPAAGVDPAARIAAGDEFGVPLTRGQATGNVGQQAFEQAARHDARGATAGGVMRNFDAQQIAAIEEAKAGISGSLGGAPTAASDAGDMVAGGLRSKADSLRRQANTAYDSAAAKDATIAIDEVGNLGKSVLNSLDTAGINLDTYGNYPGSQAAMNLMRRVAGFEGAPAPVAGNVVPFPGAPQTVAQSLQGIEQARKGLLKVKPANAEDARALRAIRGAFDDWLDDAVNRKLFSGDATALDDLKAARGFWKDYKGITAPGKDDASKIVAKIATEQKTGAEVANWLLGTAGVGQAGRSARVAATIRNELGAASPEWEALRQAAWQKMTSPTTGQGPQAVANSMLKFLAGDGAPLGRILFKPDEIDTMRRLAAVMKNTVPDARATNPSKSGYEVARMIGMNASPTVAGAAAAWGTGDPKYLAISALPLLRGASTASRAFAATRAEPAKLGQMLKGVARGGVNVGAWEAGEQRPALRVGGPR